MPACYGMRKADIDSRKTSSAESSPLRVSLPTLVQTIENSKQSASFNDSPRRGYISSVISPEKEQKKTSSLSGSPAGSRLSKTLGKRDSKELAGHLKDELAKIERSEITLTNAELKTRFEKAQTESNPILQKKELEQLACAKVKNPTFEDQTLKNQAAQLVLNINAHQLMISLQNRLTYLNQKNQQEASVQTATSIKLFFEQHDLLLRLRETEENTHEYHINRWTILRKTAPIFKRLEEHLQKNVPSDAAALQEYQAAIKEEHFLPQ